MTDVSDPNDGGEDTRDLGQTNDADVGEDVSPDVEPDGDAGEDVALDLGDDGGTDAADLGDDATDGGDDASDAGGDGDLALDSGDDAADAVGDGGGGDADADAADAGGDPDTSPDLADGGGDVEPDMPIPTEWTTPQCSSVVGTAAVTFSDDEGATRAPVEGNLAGIAYTFGLVTQPQPNLMYAEHQDEILRSFDAGCHWQVHGTISGVPVQVRMTPGPDDIAWAWSDNDVYLYRIDSEDVDRRNTAGNESLYGLAVDRTDGDHIRMGGPTGHLHESTNGGNSWARLGNSPVEGSVINYRVAFDPADWDHALYGTATTGAWVTENAGESWTQATGFSELGEQRANVFEFAISPEDGDLVWAMGIDIEVTLLPIDERPPHNGRHIYLSRDGGYTFEPVVDAFDTVPDTDITVVIRNQPTMVAHPTDPDVMYWVFGTYFGGYGTDIFRYDVSRDALTVTHSTENDDAGVLAFNPADRSIMYLGLIEESGISFSP